MLQDGGHAALRSVPPSIALAQGATFHSDWGGNNSNAPNLSRLICQMLMRLDASWPGKTSLGLDVAAGV